MGFPRDKLRTPGVFGGGSPPGRNCSGIVAHDRRNWLRAAPAGSMITGSKVARRSRSQTRIRHSIAPRVRFRSRHSEGPAQNVWRPVLGHHIHPNSHAARSSSSDGNIVRKPRPNCSVRVNPKFGAWKAWSIPVLSHLPPPVSAELFKKYSVHGHGGIMCAEVSKLPTKGEFVVFKSLTGEARTLPPMLHPGNPVLVHISVDSDKKSYKLIVAGSSAACDEHLSRKVEVFDSSTSKWEVVNGLRGAALELNEHQAGVCLNGKLFFIEFLEGGGKGVVACDLQDVKRLLDLTTPIPWNYSFNNLQLVVSDGRLFLFSDQVSDQSADHSIHELEFQNPKAGTLTCRWRTFVKEKNSGGKLGIVGMNLRNILLASLSFAFLPTGARAEDQSIQDFLCSNSIPSTAWGSLDVAKAVAGTVFAGLMTIGAARFSWKVFRNRFNIDGGLKRDNLNPRSREAELEIPPEISA